MRLLTVIGLTLLCAPVMAQDNCRYYTGDGLSVGIDQDVFGRGRLTIFATDGSETECIIAEGADDVVRNYKCGDFAGDLFLVPTEPFGTFPDIIVMPPNVLYWQCATPA